MSEFVEVKTADLVGAALDWVVAIAVGCQEISATSAGVTCIYGMSDGDTCWTNLYQPSLDWSQGGPLIEKYKLDIGAPLENKSGPWNAATEWGHPDGYKGETPLIAACRAIVASVLGETVSVPKELLS
ncbi:phage protein NinX family protein [Pseudomonas sp. RGM 3321]|uniref:phage protein NinX family protein n=1 Tax=Pseudomonas sp. RGM 3321 TaxID=2930089 RepID=UPI001FCC1155|nr:phage protein NinX family protein [Pseudomonas sp. RGM 3321]MCJ2375159.1 DUF2591 domain-containing protein [Pseudomonas sp. RGM 3321]